MSFQGIDCIQPQLDPAGGVGPHRYPGAPPDVGVLRVEPDGVTVGGGTHDPVVTLDQRHRHEPTVTSTRAHHESLTRRVGRWTTTLTSALAADPRRGHSAIGGIAAGVTRSSQVSVPLTERLPATARHTDSVTIEGHRRHRMRIGYWDAPPAHRS